VARAVFFLLDCKHCISSHEASKTGDNRVFCLCCDEWVGIERIIFRGHDDQNEKAADKENA
jgi:hypothetical protein